MNQQQLLQNKYENLDLKKLDSEIKKEGFVYKLIKRTNEKLLYSQSANGKIEAYVLFKNKILKYREHLKRINEKRGLDFNPNNYQEYKEKFPHDEEFGERAWCYKKLDSAMKDYDQLAIVNTAA